MALKNISLEEKLLRYLCFELIKEDAKLSLADINRIAGSSPTSRIAWTWNRRKKAPTDDSLNLFRDDAPNALEFFDCAPIGLLADASLSGDQIAEEISVYRSDVDDLPYKFPIKPPVTDVFAWNEPCRRDDSAALARRGDIYGFFAILALVREAESVGDAGSHLFHFRNLCQCLPMLGRFVWLREDFRLLCHILLALRNRVSTTKADLEVRWLQIDDWFYNRVDQIALLTGDTRNRSFIGTGIPDMSCIVTADDLGAPRVWPKAAEDEPSLLDGKFHYARVQQVIADKTLFTHLMLTARLWDLPLHTLAACLDLAPADGLALAGDDAPLLDDRMRTRIAMTIMLLDHLGQSTAHMNECGFVLRRPMQELGGDSVLSKMQRGELKDLVEQLEVVEHQGLSDGEWCSVVYTSVRVEF